MKVPALDYTADRVSGDRWGVSSADDEGRYVLLGVDEATAHYAVAVLNEGGVDTTQPFDEVQNDLTWMTDRVRCFHCDRSVFQGELDAAGSCTECAS